MPVNLAPAADFAENAFGSNAWVVWSSHWIIPRGSGSCNQYHPAHPGVQVDIYGRGIEFLPVRSWLVCIPELHFGWIRGSGNFGAPRSFTQGEVVGQEYFGNLGWYGRFGLTQIPPVALD